MLRSQQQLGIDFLALAVLQLSTGPFQHRSMSISLDAMMQSVTSADLTKAFACVRHPCACVCLVSSIASGTDLDDNDRQTDQLL